MSLMRRCATSLALVLAAVLAGPPAVAGDAAPAPEFTQQGRADWINSSPLKLAQLAGRPVLVEFWTFECVNCLRSLDWMKQVAGRFGPQGLAIVAVHSPEFAAERDPANVRSAVERLGIEYPVMLDPEFRYWNAMGNRYWPAFYLIGPDGTLLTQSIGEMHVGESRAERFEERIAAALRGAAESQ